MADEFARVMATQLPGTLTNKPERNDRNESGPLQSRKSLFRFLIILFFLVPLNKIQAFEQFKYQGEVSLPKAIPYEKITVDIVGRIYLLQKGKKNIAVYNRLGSQIDTVNLEEGHYFTRGADLSCDRQGNLLLLDTAQNLLRKVSPTGKTLFSIGGKGAGSSSFRSPLGIQIDEKDNLFVADTGNQRIQMFNPDGIYIGSILSGEKVGAKTDNFRLVSEEKFTGRPIPKTPILRCPVASSTDSEGYVYVLDSMTRFILIYSKNAEYMGNISLNSVQGATDMEPVGLTIIDDALFILDKKYHNIKIFNRQGEFLQEIGAKGTGRGKFYAPKALCSQGKELYVLDSGNSRIQVFSLGESKADQSGHDKEWKFKPRLAFLGLSLSEKAAKTKKLFSFSEEKLFTAFEQSGNFSMIDRKDVSRILHEQKLEALRISKSSAKKIGKWLGADLGITGTVTIFRDGKIGISALLLDLKTGLSLGISDKTAEDEVHLSETATQIVRTLERVHTNRAGGPSGPTGLFAMPSISSIFLRWDPGKEENVVKYIVYSSVQQNGPFEKIGETGIPEYEIRNLEEKKFLFFRVTAVDSESKESPPSGTVEAHPKQLPEFGYVLKVKSELLAKEIRFTWSNPEEEDIRVYQIYRALSFDGEFKLAGTTTKRSFSESGLEDGKEYFYKIRKVYGNGIMSSYSNIFSCFTDSIPQAITDLAADSDFARRILLHWKPQAIDQDLVKFVLFRSENSDGDFKEIKRVSAAKREYEDSGLKDNTSYYYKIKAIDKFGLESDFSREVFATTKDVPKTPINIVAESNLPKKIRLSWPFEAEEKDSLLFLIYKCETMTGSFKEIAKVKTPEFIDPGLPDNKTFYYFVSVRDKDGLMSGPSEIVQATTKSLPQTVASVKTIPNQPRKVTVLWNKNPEPDIDHYNVYCATSTKGSFKKITETKETVFQDEGNGRGLKDSSTYFYKITAVDSDGLESDPSEISSATTKPLPLTPEGVVVEYKNKALILSWPPVAGNDVYGYVVYKNNSKTEIIKTNLWVDTAVIPGNNYHYQIATIDNEQLESLKSEKVSYKIKK